MTDPHPLKTVAESLNIEPRDATAARDLARVIVAGFNIPVSISSLIQMAGFGWQEAHVSLCREAERITKSGEVLPLELQEYLVSIAKEGVPFKRSKGGDKFKNFGRDLCINMAIQQMIELGFSPTRNAATDAESACSIVSAALGDIGIHISEAGVAKVWEKHLKDEREDAAELNQ
jgi:hypothetical protein